MGVGRLGVGGGGRGGERSRNVFRRRHTGVTLYSDSEQQPIKKIA